jgi:hypothetical protein
MVDDQWPAVDGRSGNSIARGRQWLGVSLLGQSCMITSMPSSAHSKSVAASSSPMTMQP